MDDGAVGAGAGDRVEAEIAQLAGFLAQRLQAVGHFYLAQLARLRSAAQPAQEAADGDTVTAMGAANALQLDLVLAGLGQRHRIGIAHHGDARGLQACGRPEGAVAVSIRTRLPVWPSVSRAPPNSSGGARVTALPSQASGTVRHLAAVHVEIDMAVCVQHGKAQREGRARNVAAPHVQQPGDRIGRRDQRRIRTLGGDGLGDARPLGLARLAGKLDGLRQHGRQWRRCPVTPHRVDGIGLDRQRNCRRRAGRRAQSARSHRRSAARDRSRACRPCGRFVGDPLLGRLLWNLVRHEGRGIDLSPNGEGVAAVDEDRRLVGQCDGEARRSGEARKPAQALGAARHVLALMLIGTRHDEAVEPAAPQFGPQVFKAVRWCGRGVETVLGLYKFCPPFGQCPGQFSIGAGLHQLDPFRPCQAFGCCGHAAHQRIEGRRVGITPALAEEVKNVVWSGTHDGSGPYAPCWGQANLSNICSFAPARCKLILCHALGAYRTFKTRTYRCNSRLYICWVQRSIDYRVAQEGDYHDDPADSDF